MPRRRQSRNPFKELFESLFSESLGELSTSRRARSRSTSTVGRRGKDRIIEMLKRSKKVRREDVIKWLNSSWDANLPKSASWSEIADYIKRKVSLSALERYAKSKGVI